jgi:hypothetical protein
MNWTKQEEKKLREMYTRYSQKQLSQILNRSEGSIRWKASEIGLKKGNMRYIIQEEQKKPSKQLGYVVGVMLGDGSNVKRKSKVTGGVSYMISLSTIDKDFAEEFKKNLESWSGITASMKKYPTPNRTFPNGITSKCKDHYCVYIVSKSFGEWLERFIKETDFTKMPIDFKRSMGKGMFDSDGNILIRPGENRLTYTKKNKNVLDLFTNILSIFGIKHRITSDRLFRCLIESKTESNKFMEEIGCSIKRKLVGFYG